MPISDPDKLSRRPAQIRHRLRRSAQHLDRDLELLERYGDFKPVEQWDDAELAYGRPRNKEGNFRGPSPTWLTPKIVAEARRRWQDKSHSQLIALAGRANATLAKLMDDPATDAKTRVDIAKFIVEQTNGKASMKVDHTISTRDFLATALVLDDGQPAHPVIDGQFYEDEDDTQDEVPPPSTPRHHQPRRPD